MQSLNEFTDLYMPKGSGGRRHRAEREIPRVWFRG